MKKHALVAIGIGSALLMFSLVSPPISIAEVNVHVDVALPPLIIPAPPGMVVIPGSNVYFAPDVEADVFFYHGYWYRPHHGHWYRSSSYRGPWGPIVITRVPRAVIAVPPGFRQGPMYERVPYRDVRKNWRTWERDRYWEKRRHGGEHRGLEKGERRGERRGEHEALERGKHRDEKVGEHRGREKGEHLGEEKGEHEGRERHGR